MNDAWIELEAYIKRIRDQALQPLIKEDLCVYHYTNANGLLGILKCRSLWATHYRFLSDVSEVKYATTAVAAQLAQCRDLNSGLAREVFDQALPFLKDLDYRGAYPSRPQPFFASFCALDDDPSLWRIYGAGGNGFAIGFDLRLLPGSLGPWLPVEYDGNRQRLRLQHFINGYLDLIRRWAPRIADQTHAVQRIADEFVRDLVTQAVCFKAPSFLCEKEWRIIHWGHRDDGISTSFRAGRFGLIPYKVLPFKDRSPIRRVILGPTVDRDLAAYSLKDLLSSLGYADVEIGFSKTPLR